MQTVIIPAFLYAFNIYQTPKNVFSLCPKYLHRKVAAPPLLYYPGREQVLRSSFIKNGMLIFDPKWACSESALGNPDAFKFRIQTGVL